MQNQLESLKEQTVSNSNPEFEESYYTTENETRIRSLEEIAKKNKYKFMKEGLTLIKPELTEEWINFVNENGRDQYFAIVIEAIVSIMDKINNGIPFIVAQKQTCVDELELSGFQEGAVTCAVSHFYNNKQAINDSVEPYALAYSKK